MLRLRPAWFFTVTLLTAAIAASGCQRIADVIPGNAIASDAVIGAPPTTPAMVTPVTTERGGPTAIPDAILTTSIVQVQPALSGDGQPNVTRSGSGVVIDTDERLILTSYEVVRPYLPDGTPAYSTILISTNRKLGNLPTLEFEADLVSADPVNGIAVLRVTRDSHGGTLTSGRFNLPAAGLGDARTAAAGLSLRVYGHPGPGDGRPQSLLVNTASVTGIRGAPGATNRTWLKTNVRLPYGAAGGGAFNQAGALIGILGQDHYQRSAEVGQIRPLELALPVIERARTETVRYQASVQMGTNIPGTALPTPDDQIWISAPVFGANAIQSVVGRDLFDYGTRFPAGRPALYYEYALQGVPTGAMIEERWYLNDLVQDPLSSSFRWDGRGFAIQSDRIASPGAAGIPGGRWRIEIWVHGQLRSQATALVDVEPKKPEITGAGSSASAAPDGKPAAEVSPTSTQVLMFFDFTGMENVQNMEWRVFHNNQHVYASPVLHWEYGDSGRTWIGYAPGRELGSGKWEIELHADSGVLGMMAVTVP